MLAQAGLKQCEGRDDNGNYPEFSMGKPQLPHVYSDSRLPDFVSEESWLIFDVNLAICTMYEFQNEDAVLIHLK